MASKRFNLGDYNLPGLSVSAPETEQIKLIPLDLIDPDPNNFYSLEGIDELAANIETVGLLDPLRVRPVGERYTLVSGHRRRAACMLIRDGGSEMFKHGVPSIVERGEASDALRELRLLSANSATRIMSDAELSKQAERMTAVLYQLKQEGYKFPGKMRTIVAQACQVSESKLARLHAIRSRGHEYTVDLFDKGEISESVAYELSKIPTDLQKLFIVAREHDCYRFDVLTANDIREFDDLRKKLTFLKCPLAATPGITCNCSTARIETALHHHGLIDPVPYCVRGKCCKSCPMLRDCEDRCIRCDTIAAQQEAEIERKAEETETARKAEDALREQAKAEAYDALCTAAINRLGKNNAWDGEENADEDVSRMDTSEPQWMTGIPTRRGRYFCQVDMGDSKPHENRCWWGDDGWSCYGSNLKANGWKVVGWWPLPKEG